MYVWYRMASYQFSNVKNYVCFWATYSVCVDMHPKYISLCKIPRILKLYCAVSVVVFDKAEAAVDFTVWQQLLTLEDKNFCILHTELKLSYKHSRNKWANKKDMLIIIKTH